MTRLILATSGGFVPGPTQMSVRVGAMISQALSRTGKERPKVCVVNTALGDTWEWQSLCVDAFGAAGCDVSVLRLFPQPDSLDRVTGADLVWVGGGSVANLLALWRLHGVDAAMREAWESGVILGGVSRGEPLLARRRHDRLLRPRRCERSPTASASCPTPTACTTTPRPSAGRSCTSLIADGTLPALAYATDDHIGIWYEGIEATAVVADVEVDPATGPAAYRVELVGADVVETRVGVGSSF